MTYAVARAATAYSPYNVILLAKYGRNTSGTRIVPSAFW